jgi:hypothetical protein
MLPPRLLCHPRERASSEGTSIYLYGSTKPVVNSLAESLTRMFPEINIVGSEPSAFSKLNPDEKVTLQQRIQSSGSSIIFVGLGCPRHSRSGSYLCVIAYAPNLISTGHASVVGGLNTAGTHGGSNAFVLTPSLMMLALQRARAAHDRYQQFELTIGADNVAINASAPQLILERISSFRKMVCTKGMGGPPTSR